MCPRSKHCHITTSALKSTCAIESVRGDGEYQRRTSQHALDTCAEASIASHSLWHRLGEPALKTPPKLRAYGGGEVPALGQCDVDVQYEGKR